MLMMLIAKAAIHKIACAIIRCYLSYKQTSAISLKYVARLLLLMLLMLIAHVAITNAIDGNSTCCYLAISA